MYREVCLYDLLQEKKTKRKKKHPSEFQPPSRASTYDPNDTIPARTKVFGINELLSLILSDTSVYELGAIRRVCKKWNAVGHDISSIELCMSPARVHTDIVHPYPEYLEHEYVSFNPAVTVSQEYRSMDSSNEVCHMEFNVNCDFISFDLRRLGCEFLTRPPITQLALTADSLTKPGGNAGETRKISMLSMDNGIRLWHPAEAFRKLRRDSSALPCRKECKGHRVSAHLICDKLPELVDSRKVVFEWTETID
jgi:hypothetical protein